MASPQVRVVLLVDQFEEVFTLTTDEAERQHFFDLLVTAVTEPRGSLFIILTLRADLRASAVQRTLLRIALIATALLLISSMWIAGFYAFLQLRPTLVTTLQDNDEVGSLRWCINNAPSGSTIGFAQDVRGTMEKGVEVRREEPGNLDNGDLTHFFSGCDTMIINLIDS